MVATQLTVLIIYEQRDLARYSHSQRAVLASPTLHAWLRAQNANWRIWDKDTPVVGTDAGALAWRAALAKLKPRYAGVPLLFVEGAGKPAIETAIDPAQTEASILQLLKDFVDAPARSGPPAHFDRHSAAPWREFELDPTLQARLFQLAA